VPISNVNYYFCSPHNILHSNGISKIFMKINMNLEACCFNTFTSKGIDNTIQNFFVTFPLFYVIYLFIYLLYFLYTCIHRFLSLLTLKVIIKLLNAWILLNLWIYIQKISREGSGKCYLLLYYSVSMATSYFLLSWVPR
jgi:hypothetical protein